MICITMISSIMYNFWYNNNVQKFPKAFRKRNVRKIGTPFGTLARRVEKLARRLAHFHATFKHWHIVWHVDTFMGTVVRKIETLTSVQDVGTQARWHVNCASTHACWHVNHAGVQARRHVDHFGTQERMARDLACSLHF